MSMIHPQNSRLLLKMKMFQRYLVIKINLKLIQKEAIKITNKIAVRKGIKIDKAIVVQKVHKHKNIEGK